MGSNEDTRASRFFEAVTARPKTVVAASVVLVALIAAGLPGLVRDTRGEAFVRQDAPSITARDRVHEIFGLRDPMVVAVVHDGEHGVFRPSTLGLIKRLSERIQDLDAVEVDDVRSIATENDIIGTDDDMLVEPFYEETPTTQAEADSIRDAVLGFELMVGTFASEDGSTALIVAEFEDESEAEDLYRQILEIVAETPVSGEEIHVAGEGAAVARLGAYIDADARRLNPISAMVITLILFVAYRTLRGILAPNLILIGTVVTAMGAMAWAGVPVYVITNSLPPLLIAVAVADAVHVMGQYYEEYARNPGAEQRDLVVTTMVKMWRPVTVTSVTDIVGFLAIALASYMPPMRYFGAFAGVGILAALLLSLITLPAALMLLQPKGSKAFRPEAPDDADADADADPDRFGVFMATVGRTVIGRPWTVLGVLGAISALAMVGALGLRVDQSRMMVFDHDEPLRIADNVINRRLSGTNYLDVMVESDRERGLYDPESLRKIEALQEYLETRPDVASTWSIVDYIKQMNRAMNGEREEFYRIPDRSDLVAQYLLLYEVSGDPSDFDHVVDYEYRRANVRAALVSGLYSRITPVIESTQQFVDESFTSPNLQATISGRLNIDYHWIGNVAKSHFRGVALALLGIWMMTALTFRSLAAGLYCTFPVLAAVLVIYAIMGTFDIPLGIGTTMFGAIALGTGVDFAVHTIDRVIVGVRERGESLEKALENLYPTTGRALLFSFGALSLGFAVLMTSYVPTLIKFGALVTAAVSAAFLASLTALPALMLVMRPRFLGESSRDSAVASAVPGRGTVVR